MTGFANANVRTGPPNSFLVLVEPMLVAIDISMTIAELEPRARVIVVEGVRNIGAALQGVGKLQGAFLGLAPGSDAGIRLAGEVRLRGGWLVFIGDEAEDQGPGPDWTVLMRPFTTACVAEAFLGRPPAQSGSFRQQHVRSTR